MIHPLATLTSTTPGIVELWITELLDSDEQDDVALAIYRSSPEPSPSDKSHLHLGNEAWCTVSPAYLRGYVQGLFDAYEAGQFHALDLIYLRNEQDNVRVVVDCRRFLIGNAVSQAVATE